MIVAILSIICVGLFALVILLSAIHIIQLNINKHLRLSLLSSEQRELKQQELIANILISKDPNKVHADQVN